MHFLILKFYRSYDSLVEDLTRLLEDKLNGAIRTIFALDGKRIEKLDDLEDNKAYVCCCNNEAFKKIDYSATIIKNTNRLSKVIRPHSPLKNGNNGSLKEVQDTSVVHPRIVTLIRNGVKPRKIMRLLLNKRNSPTYDHVLTAITQVRNLIFKIILWLKLFRHH